MKTEKQADRQAGLVGENKIGYARQTVEGGRIF